jgi:hypothetical protein
MGKRGLLIASANIDGDKEKEFNQFYNEKHLDVSLRIPGYVTGQLFQVFQDMNLSGAVTDAPPDTFYAGKTRKFITVYEVDYEEAIAGLGNSPEGAAAAKEFFEWLPYVKDLSVTFYEPISQKKSRKASVGGAA